MIQMKMMDVSIFRNDEISKTEGDDVIDHRILLRLTTSFVHYSVTGSGREACGNLGSRDSVS